jgi:hypothetical protein
MPLLSRVAALVASIVVVVFVCTSYRISNHGLVVKKKPKFQLNNEYWSNKKFCNSFFYSHASHFTNSISHTQKIAHRSPIFFVFKLVNII